MAMAQNSSSSGENSVVGIGIGLILGISIIDFFFLLIGDVESFVQITVSILFFASMLVGIIYFNVLPLDGKLGISPFPKVTLILVGFNCSVFLIEILMSFETRCRFFAFNYGSPNPFNLMISNFSHGGIPQLGFNILFLWIFGTHLESRIGWKKYVGFYFLTGIIAALGDLILSFLFRSDWKTMHLFGASGAVFGISGIFSVRCYFHKLLLKLNPATGEPRLRAIVIIVIMVIGNLFSIFVSLSPKYRQYVQPAGLWANMIGFGAGVLLALAMGYQRHSRADVWMLEGIKASRDNNGFAETETNFRKALQIFPGDVLGRLSLSRLVSKMALKKDEAEKLYREAIEVALKADSMLIVEACNEHFTIYLSPLPLVRAIPIAKNLVTWDAAQLASNVLELAFRQADPSDPHWAQAGLLLAQIFHENLNIFEPTLWIYDLLLQKVQDPAVQAIILERCQAMGVGSVGYETPDKSKGPKNKGQT
jgi:membrane associated rhomboid family serine protease